jgi:C4-dicarboxylate-binding protein DctP
MCIPIASRVTYNQPSYLEFAVRVQMVKTPISWVAALSVFLLVFLSFFWWYSKPAAGPDLKTGNASSVHAAEVRQLRLGLNIAADSALHAAALKFAEQVDARTKGKLKVTVFPNQQLGSDDQMLEMARKGELDLILIPTAKLSSAIPAMQYADLPFYFDSREELYAMLDGEPGRLLLAKMNSIDLIGLTFWENGFKQFTANTPIRAPDDFAKLRIRTMKSPLIADQFASLGAQPIPIDFHATYQALAEGAVDGQENPLVAIVGMRFHEVQKHLTLSNHAYLGYVFSASKHVFEKLSPDLREIIQQTARDLTVWEREETARREANFIETIRSAGVEIHTLSEVERQRFSAAMAPIADKFAFKVGYDLIAKTEELRFAKQASDAVVLGLDADLSVGGTLAGGAIYRGIELALEEINQKGGLLGKPVRVIARDHAANAQIARANLQYFADQPNVVAVMGGLQSTVVAEELADIHRLGMPFLIPWAAAPGLIDHDFQPSYTYRVSLTDNYVAPFLLEYARKLGGRTVILLARSSWGRSNEAALKSSLEKLPAGSAEIVWLEASNTQIDEKIDALVNGGMSSMLLVASSNEVRQVVKAMARQAKPVPIFSHWSLSGDDFFIPMQTALQKVDLRFVQTVLINEAQTYPKLGAFLNRYRKRYQLEAESPIPALIASVHAYDLTHLLALAVKRAKSSDRVAIRAALESLPRYSGLFKDYNPAFTRDRHDALDRSYLRLARYDERGHIVSAE